MTFDPRGVLLHNAQRPDRQIALFDVALAFAGFSHPGVSIDRYRQHGVKLCDDVRLRHAALVAAGAADDAGSRLAALKFVIVEQEQYTGDRDTYDDLQNADLMRVIDRRKGLPVSLAILYMHAGRAQGWEVEALNFPGHVLCRIEHLGVRIIFDPFEDCAVMEAPELRGMLKQIRGPQAELSADFYRPVTTREVLIRLQNNIKLRLIEGEDYEAALSVVERMQLFAPEEYRLSLDRGVLLAKTGRLPAAIESLRDYAGKVPDARDRYDAERMIAELQRAMRPQM